MSNLSSQFDIIKGWPGGSGLHYNFKQKAAVTPDIEEGTIVAVEDETNVPVVDVWTSAAGAGGNFDHPWIVIQGADQSDADFAQKLTCLKLRTGIIFQVVTAQSFVIGDSVYADAGVPKPTGSGEPFGRVIDLDPTNNTVTVES